MQRCPLHKPITAAYLYILNDYHGRTNPNRAIVAKKIFKLLENKYLSENELVIFDYTVSLFARVLNNEIIPRGDWYFYNGDLSALPDNLFLCYGDLIFDFDLLKEYTNFTHPTTIRPIDVQIKFMDDFKKLLPLLDQYQQDVILQ